jgi:tetratricopeptide (TPR) repeat protein
MRPHPSGAAEAAFDWRVVLIRIATVVAVLTISGCAILGRRGRTGENVTAGRELSRQGVAALEAGQPIQAEELLKKSLAASPDDASAHRYMAEVLWCRSARDEALSQISESVRLEPTNAGFAVRAGEMMLESGRRDFAAAYAERAIHLDPKLATAWALRGRSFQQLNQPDRALADLQRAVELAPERSDLLLEVAAIYRQRGQNERCLAAVYQLLDSYPPGEEPQSALVLQGQTLMALGRANQASDAFLAATNRRPPSADVYFYLAQSYSASGRSDEATVAAQQALSINADHQPSRQLLSQLAARSDQSPTQRK